MTITLTNEQQEWIAAHVARGHFQSVEEAARQLIDAQIAELALAEQDDFAWARPHVHEALVEAARGDVISREEHRARNVARLAALKE